MKYSWLADMCLLTSITVVATRTLRTYKFSMIKYLMTLKSKGNLIK